MKQKFYLFFLSNRDYYSIICRDLQSINNCFLCKDDFFPELHNPVKNFVRRCHVSKKLRSFVILPFQDIWYPKIPDIPPEKDIVAVFYQSFAGAEDPVYKEYLQNRYHVKKFVFILTNPLTKFDCKLPHFVLKKYFDLVLSDDMNDCKNYGFTYWEDNYSKTDFSENDIVKSDVFFVGANKGRLPVLHKIYKRLSDSGLLCDFTITEVDDDDDRIFPGIHYNVSMPYREVQRRVCGCDTILEVVQSNQVGLTLRTQEALSYGKKLLTNNNFLLKKPYYTPDNIQIFSDPEQINLQWLLKRRSANYRNKPDFSALNLLNFLDSNL